MRFFKDKTNELAKRFGKTLEDYFPHLKDLAFLYIWRVGDKMDENGRLVLAEVRKFSNRDRDTFGFDCCIEVDKNKWDEMEKQDKFRISYHELCHVKLEYEAEFDSEGEPIDLDDRVVKHDKEGRIVFRVAPHDIVVTRFRAELEKFGLDEEEDEVRKFFTKVRENKPLRKVLVFKSKEKDEDKGKKKDKGKTKVLLKKKKKPKHRED